MTSILPAACFTLVFLLLASCRDCSARTLLFDQSDAGLRPVVSQSQIHRICTELCSSGLGGTPCGSDCVDLVPDSLPLVSGNSKTNASLPKGYNISTRQDSCNVLCQNGLGYPLCSCQYDSSKTYNPDYVNICSTYCISYGYQIFGCQPCSIYKSFADTFSSDSGDFSVMDATPAQILDWSLWCNHVCPNGNGGAACSCDLLP